jgi:uncharacterized membrane protein
MIEFKNSITIKRSLSEVFEFVSDFENLPKWNYYILDVSMLSNGPIGEGTKYHQLRKTDQQDFQVIKFVPNRLVTIETLPPERPLKMRFEFEPTDNGTQIKDIWQLETGVPKPFNWFAARKVKSAVSENLRKLKDLLETGHVILQDGRERHLES